MNKKPLFITKELIVCTRDTADRRLYADVGKEPPPDFIAKGELEIFVQVSIDGHDIGDEILISYEKGRFVISPLRGVKVTVKKDA